MSEVGEQGAVAQRLVSRGNYSEVGEQGQLLRGW